MEQPSPAGPSPAPSSLCVCSASTKLFPVFNTDWLISPGIMEKSFSGWPLAPLGRGPHALGREPPCFLAYTSSHSAVKVGPPASISGDRQQVGAGTAFSFSGISCSWKRSICCWNGETFCLFHIRNFRGNGASHPWDQAFPSRSNRSYFLQVLGEPKLG